MEPPTKTVPPFGPVTFQTEAASSPLKAHPKTAANTKERKNGHMNRLYHYGQLSASSNRVARYGNCAKTRPMKRSPLAVSIVALLLLLLPGAVRAQEDAAIDKLIKKLPPPEKLVKPIRRAVQADDPAVNDPLVSQIAQAVNADNLASCLNLSRKLTEKYPHSPGA